MPEIKRLQRLQRNYIQNKKVKVSGRVVQSGYVEIVRYYHSFHVVPRLLTRYWHFRRCEFLQRPNRSVTTFRHSADSPCRSKQKPPGMADSLSIKPILPPTGGRKSISRRKKGHFFAKKVPLFQKQSTGLFLKFTPEKSAALGDFAVCGRRPGLSALDLTSFLKKAGSKTFAFASRFQECFLTD